MSERVGLSVINAGKSTGIYVLDTVLKLGSIFAVDFLHKGEGHFLPDFSAMREQLKENITLLCSHVARRYEYYTFPVYQTKEDFKTLSKEELEAARLHYTAYPQVWEGFSLSMQLAFNLLLKEQGLPLLPCTAPLKRDESYTKEELELTASERYHYYQLTAEESSVFFHHHLEPPEYYLERQALPQIPIPEASEVSNLSEEQVRWFHQIMMAEQTDLSLEQYSAFSKCFYKLGLLAPNENFVFDVELPPPIGGYIPRAKAYYYYLYVKAGRDQDLSIEKRVQLQQFLIKRELASTLSTILEENLFVLTKDVLSPYVEQFETHRFLWRQQLKSFRSEFNQALQSMDLGRSEKKGLLF